MKDQFVLQEQPHRNIFTRIMQTVALLYIDESEEQDKKIMDYQRLISAGKVNEEQEYKSRELLKNVQRLLKPIKVINPFAEYLQLPKSVFKPRRTNSHYLNSLKRLHFTSNTNEKRSTTRKQEKNL